MNRALRRGSQLLARYYDWLNDRLSDDWYDLRTRSGLLNGLFSMVVNIVQFSLILLLVVLLGGTATRTTRPPTAAILSLPAAFLYGATMILIYQYIDRVNTAMRSYPSNLKTGIPLQLFTYGAYALLLWYHAGLGVVTAVAYLAGKLTTLLVLFLPSELKRLSN